MTKIKDVVEMPEHKRHQQHCQLGLGTAGCTCGANEANNMITRIAYLEVNLPQAQWDREKLAEKLYTRYERHKIQKLWSEIENPLTKKIWLAEADAIIKAFPAGKTEQENHFDIYIPGCSRCPKCNFHLVSNIISLSSGNITADIRTPENCPNDGTEMMAVTWKERCKELAERLEQELTKKPEPPATVAKEVLKNDQFISDPIKGDCFRACITSLLGIPNTHELPDGDKDWFIGWSKYLGNMGLNIHYTEEEFWRNGYWIASVKSLNFPDVTHAIIMNCQEVYHDPSPNKKYVSGENLLGKDVVLGAWYFEVEDFSKFHKFRKEL